MDSAPINGLIYQAVYISIFLVATTITVNLFSTINSYTEDVSAVVKSDDLSEVVSENEAINVEQLLNELENYSVSGYEVFSLVNNYGLMTSDGYSYGKKYNLSKNEIPNFNDPFFDEEAFEKEQASKIALNLGYEIYVYDKKNKRVEKLEDIKLEAEYKINKKNINQGIWILEEVK